ncbi:hypothetical protein Plano_1193 [Planococcus sp. PAMC 21323]|uniref:prepilin-type N-terminal cleavage/methylation domain-containing protein n=1 Tax=Planococcus sp. PAMC 21323 TaxID=1526927 RepID=UPI0005709704|nr:prepilin-type N-terminal cleavage/methylation domain-containing protein [Planococcus sp. PAMC 21323]AIY05158.1 hypothetical protein Plano_1193 [Planococcus sp. PAMC 21323]
MKKYLQQKLNNEKGMTLIELLAVIVIIAIIAAIAIPAIGSIIENSRNGAVKADFQQALASANLYVTETGTVPPASSTNHLTDLAPYIEDKGSLKEVIITRDAASKELKITGKAELNNGTKYEIKTAISNSGLGKIENKNFTGVDIK